MRVESPHSPSVAPRTAGRSWPAMNTFNRARLVSPRRREFAADTQAHSSECAMSRDIPPFGYTRGDAGKTLHSPPDTFF